MAFLRSIYKQINVLLKLESPPNFLQYSLLEYREIQVLCFTFALGQGVRFRN